MTPNRITMLFQMLGAQPDALNVEQPVMPSVQEVHESKECCYAQVHSTINMPQMVRLDQIGQDCYQCCI